MKIGIITLWQSSDNYGQQLQCWALQQELIKLGHDPYLIRYDVEYRTRNNKSPLWKKALKLVLIYPVIKSLKRRKIREKEQLLKAYNAKRNNERQFLSFRKDNFLVSDNIYSTLQELKDNPPEADAYIVGSDQVWAFTLDNYENRVMFLDFGDKKIKRIAYAPSFSMPSYPEKLKLVLKENLDRFDSLSVREQTGAKICNDIGCTAQVVVDPTMLLTSKDYSAIVNANTCGSYIYLYYLNISNSEEVEWQQLHEFANNNNLKIIATPASGYIQGKELFDKVEYQYATIPQWLGFINGARLVVTTSFHGVVFCIIHRTSFIYFPLKGKYSRGNNRVIDLCKILGLSDYIWNESSSFDSLFHKIIDWENVDTRLKAIRIDSIDYLKNSLL